MHVLARDARHSLFYLSPNGYGHRECRPRRARYALGNSTRRPNPCRSRRQLHKPFLKKKPHAQATCFTQSAARPCSQVASALHQLLRRVSHRPRAEAPLGQGLVPVRRQVRPVRRGALGHHRPNPDLFSSLILFHHDPYQENYRRQCGNAPAQPAKARRVCNDRGSAARCALRAHLHYGARVGDWGAPASNVSKSVRSSLAAPRLFCTVPLRLTPTWD